jgi:hypothetical protein
MHALPRVLMFAPQVGAVTHHSEVGQGVACLELLDRLTQPGAAKGVAVMCQDIRVDHPV